MDGERAGARLAASRVLAAMVALFALNLLLRVFYLRYHFVNGDETVRALTAAQVLEGARLYADIVTDKPPLTTFFYALVFALFGRSMVAVHIAAAVWNFATALVIYSTAARLYTRTVGLWAALLFVYFSTNYLTQDMMAANTELLMALPYAGAFYFFVTARGSKERALARLFGAGLMTGLAALFKQVGVFNLAFFALYEIFAAYDARSRGEVDSIARAARGAIVNLLTVAMGFAAVMASFALWLISVDALGDFWRNAVVLGRLYVGSIPPSLWLKYMFGRTLAYIFFNAALWWLAVWAAARAVKQYLYARRSHQPVSPAIHSDLAVTLWAAASLVAIGIGGRFFGHYFIQALPALALLAARCTELLGRRLDNPARRRRAKVAAAAIAGLFLFGFIRFHQRTAILAYETLIGEQTRFSESWGMTRREGEAAIVAGRLRGLIGEGEPLYIWGTALDVYWLSGNRPASRYLTPYYITGEFPDAATTAETAGETFFREARAHLIEDLARTRPRVILDVYGALLGLPYPELVEFIKSSYEPDGKIGPDPARPFVVLKLKE